MRILSKQRSWISFSFQIKRSHNGVKSLLLYSEIDIPLGWSVCVTNCSNTQRLALPSDRALEQTQQKNIALAEDSTNVFLNLKKGFKKVFRVVHKKIIFEIFRKYEHPNNHTTIFSPFWWKKLGDFGSVNWPEPFKVE